MCPWETLVFLCLIGVIKLAKLSFHLYGKSLREISIHRTARICVDGDHHGEHQGIAGDALTRLVERHLVPQEGQELGLGIRHLAADTARLIRGVGSSNRQADIAQAACRDLARATARYATLELTLRNRREWPALEAALT